jgi:hypothetical protein
MMSSFWRALRATIAFAVLYLIALVVLLAVWNRSHNLYIEQPPFRFFLAENLLEILFVPWSALPVVIPSPLLMALAWGLALALWWLRTTWPTRIVHAALLLVVAPILWLLFGGAVAWMRERQLDERWTRTWKPPDALAASVQDRENESSRRLKALAAAAGVTSEWQHLDALQKYVSDQTGRADAQIDPPPQEIRYVLIGYRLELAQLTDHLRTAQVPRWTEDDYRSAPRTLNQVLTAKALAAQARGDLHDARNTADALAQVARAFQRRPGLLAIRYWILIAGRLSGLARTMPPPLPPWHAELTGRDVRTAVLDAAEHKAAVLQQSVAKDQIYAMPEPNPWLRRVCLPFVKPHLRFAAVRASENIRRQAEAFRNHPICAVAPTPPSEPQLNLFDYELFDTRSLPRLMIDLLTTEQIDRVKRGEQPTKDPRCPGLRWEIIHIPDGPSAIRARGALPAMGGNGLTLFYRYASP